MILEEGCPIHPTRVDSSLVFVIRLTGNRFVNPSPSNRHESFPLLSIRHARSRFARDLQNIADLGLKGGMKMLLIRVDSIESTRIVPPAVDSTCRKLTCTNNVGWVKKLMLLIRLDSTWIIRIDWSLWQCFKNEEGSCVFISQILTSGGLCRVAWKCCRFDSIWSNPHELLPLLSICHAGSRFVWDTSCESSRVVKCLIRIDSVWVYWTSMF